MSDELDNLLKNDGATPLEPGSKKFSYSKRKINAICRSLSIETRKYNPQKSVESIESYLKSPDKIERILYSEISNYVFSLDVSDRGVFATNIEKLLLFVLDEGKETGADCKKIVIKIYDHFQLALHQIENINVIFANSIEEVKDNLMKEMKGVEKEYISILGIFAAIVLAFVGGITFSSNVLQNISEVSIFRLIVIVDFLAFILLNVIYLLIHFIFKINEKETAMFNIKWINIACLCIGIAAITGWLLNVQSLAEYIGTFLPWK